MRRLSVLVGVVLAVALFSDNAWADLYYDVIDLGTISGGWSSTALSINNSGQIVGEASTSSGNPHAALFNYNGSNIDLGTLGGPSSIAYEINDNGQIAGQADTLQEERPTLFNPSGSNTDIGDISGNESSARSINNSGQIVGWAVTSSGDAHATQFQAGGNIDLGTLGGNKSGAMSINNNGQVVGYSETTSGDKHATLFQSVGGNIDLGDLGAESYSIAYSINDNGQIVGQAHSTNAGLPHATLFDSSGSGNNTDLGTLGGDQSYAKSINNMGHIVGNAFDTTGLWRATLFDSTGSGNNIDLNTLISPTSGWDLRVAFDINDKGWIVGSGKNRLGQPHAYLLKLVSESLIADAGGPYSLDMGGSIVLGGSITGDYSEAAWDLNLDGLFDDAFGLNPLISSNMLTSWGFSPGMTWDIGFRATSLYGTTVDYSTTQMTLTPVPSAVILGSLGLTFSGWLLKRKRMI